MLKIFGILCILSGSTGIGLTCARELELRITELQELQQALLQLRGEIRYMHQPLAEAFLHIAGNAPEPFRKFFLHTAGDLQKRNGQTAEEIWGRNLKNDMAELHVSRKEMGELKKLGSMLGYLDVEMQISALDYYLEQLRLSVEQAREAAGNRRRLYQYMGILGGAALVILIF